MIPQETVKTILETAQITDVVGDFVTLKRRGADFVACCPFHNEKTPSFHVSPSRGIFKCFGCGEAGSSVAFLMKHEHLTYVEALRYLANKYHIEVHEEEETAEQLAAKQKSESLYIVSDYAEKFFKQSLYTTEGKSIGLAYFHSRGLTDETIQKYGLGWAPKNRHELTDQAVKAGYKTDYLVETGLSAKYEDGNVRDRFYDRVIFPIYSVSGRVIAFGGRTLYNDYKERGVGKYVNSKESEIYIKSRSLYGISFAKNEISKKDKCYLVEGYLDVLSMHQLGMTNVVASSGTALTVEQIRIIKRFTNNVTIMYDGDAAGIHAAIRGIGMVLKEGMDVKVLLIPDGDDPDSYSRKHTLEEVETFIVQNEQDFINFKTDLLLEDAGEDPLKKANLINDIADTIANIPDAVKRSVYVEFCSRRFNIDASILFNRILSTRERLLQEERQASQRSSYNSGSSQPLGTDTSASNPSAPRQYGASQAKPLMTDPLEAYETNKTVGPTERDIIYFLLRYGSDLMDFPTDSEYYSADGAVTVAEFIDASLGGDNMELINEGYRKVYNCYMDRYFSEMAPSQDEIIRDLLNNSDDVVRSISAQLIVDKYQLTVGSFAAALTTTPSWLVAQIPKLIMTNLEKRLDYKLDQIKKKMASADGDIIELMTEFKSVTDSRNLVRTRLGKEKEQ